MHRIELRLRLVRRVSVQQHSLRKPKCKKSLTLQWSVVWGGHGWRHRKTRKGDKNPKSANSALSAVCKYSVNIQLKIHFGLVRFTYKNLPVGGAGEGGDRHSESLDTARKTGEKRKKNDICQNPQKQQKAFVHIGKVIKKPCRFLYNIIYIIILIKIDRLDRGCYNNNV